MSNYDVESKIVEKDDGDIVRIIYVNGRTHKVDVFDQCNNEIGCFANIEEYEEEFGELM